MSPEFVDLGIKSAEEWFQTLSVPYYQRQEFGVLLALITIPVVLLIFFGLCVKRARKRIDQNQEHMLALLNGGESDAPHFYTNEARVSAKIIKNFCDSNIVKL